MTEAMLIAVIHSFCIDQNLTTRNPYSLENKEKIINCFEDKMNCAIRYNKNIMTMKEFEEVCIKK